jgi:hypothetical protein
LLLLKSDLTLFVTTEERIFDYICHVTITIIEEELNIVIWDFETETEKIFILEDLPFKYVLEESE